MFVKQDEVDKKVEPKKEVVVQDDEDKQKEEEPLSIDRLNEFTQTMFPGM